MLFVCYSVSLTCFVWKAYNNFIKLNIAVFKNLKLLNIPVCNYMAVFKLWHVSWNSVTFSLLIDKWINHLRSTGLSALYFYNENEI